MPRCLGRILLDCSKFPAGRVPESSGHVGPHSTTSGQFPDEKPLATPHSRRRTASRKALATAGESRSSRAATFGIVAVVGLLTLFLSAPQEGEIVATLFGDHTPSAPRIEVLGKLLFVTLMLPDEVAASWVGDDGQPGGLDRWPVVAAMLAILLVAWGLGSLVLRGIGWPRCDPLTDFVMALGGGLQGLSLIILLIGLCSGLHTRWMPPAIGVLVAGAVIVLAARDRRKKVFRGISDPQQGHALPFPAADRATPEQVIPIVICGLPLVAVILLGGLLPPIDFDVREYHLQAPKEFFLAGTISYLPHNVYANMPLGSEMFAIAGSMILNDWWLGSLVGKTILALYALFAATAVFAFTRRLAGSRAAWFATALYLSTPWVLRVANRGLNENAYAFHLVLTLLAIHVYLRRTDSGSKAPAALIMAGFQTGAAVSVKYPALAMVVVPVAIGIGWVRGRAANWKTAVAAIATYGLAAFLACSPWLIKNTIATGNPVYPLLTEVLPVDDRPPRFAEQWHRAHSPPNYELHDLLARIADFAWRSPSQSPLLVAFAITAIVSVRCRQAVLVLALYCLTFLSLWWLLTHRIDRFWVPLLPVVAVLGGLGANVSAAVWWRRATTAAIVGWLLISSLLAATPLGVHGYSRYLASYNWLRAAPERIRPWRAELNDQLPHDRPILSVGDAEVFDFEMPVYYNTVFDPWLLRQWLGEGSWEEQRNRLRDQLARRSIQTIVVHWPEIARYRNTYDRGFDRSGLIRPALFDRLVADGILEIVDPTVANEAITRYRVVQRE